MADFTARIDDILGCGEKGATQKAQVYLTRQFGALEIQETNLNHVSMEIAQHRDSSTGGLLNKVFTAELQLFCASAELRKQHRRPLGPSEIRDR